MRPQPRLGVFTGIASLAARSMSEVSIGLIAAQRQGSILFAMLICWSAFYDNVVRLKAVAGLLIVAGVVLTRI